MFQLLKLEFPFFSSPLSSFVFVGGGQKLVKALLSPASFFKKILGVFRVIELKSIPPISVHFPFPRVVNEFIDDSIAGHTLVTTDTNFRKFLQTFPTKRNPGPSMKPKEETKGQQRTAAHV